MSRLARIASVAFGAMAALMLAGYDERPQVREDAPGKFRDKPDGSAVAVAALNDEAAQATQSGSGRHQNENESRPANG